MKIFLDTANLDAVKKWGATGLINGVTTNPTHLSKEGGDPTKQVLALCAALPKGEISVEVTEKDPQAVYKQAKEIAALAQNIVVKIPCQVPYFPIIKQLSEEGVKVNVTLVFTLLQGMAMGKLGAYIISPFIGRWDDIDVEGGEVLYELRHMVNAYRFKTQILAASLRHVRHLHRAVLAGADIATVPVDVFEKAMHHPLTEHGVALFDADWQKLGIRKFP